MINAFLYLRLTSARNALVQRLRRLKQPKYLVGAIVGAGYFYFFFLRHVFRPSGRQPGAGPAASLPADLAPDLASFAALLLFVVVVLAWVIPSGRAVLQFSEAEVAFLFPAPVTRRRLVHYKLLRSQFTILVSTFFLALVFRRGGLSGGSPLTHAAGWWIVLSTLNLHFTGASFAREQLLRLGIHPLRRRMLALGILAAIVAGAAWWIRREVAPPGPEDLASLARMVKYFGGVLQHPPVGWILAPFALVTRPYFAADGGAFLMAAGPALLMLGAHYWWVIRADVSFEEASIEQARKTAEIVAAARSGGWGGGRNRSTKPRPAAFRLAPAGPAELAFLWKNLTALGPFFRMRTWLALAGLVVGFLAWAAATRLHPTYYTIAATLSLSAGGWLLIAGPMLMRRDLRLMVSHFDLLKGYPLRGWQVVLGSLLSPLLILAAVEWLLLLLGAGSIGSAAKAPALAAGVLGTGALGIGLLLPPLAGLMLSIPFAATLYFPAWTESRGSRGGGIEVMGQRLIFFAGYLLVLLVALVPAVLCGGATALIVHWLAGTIAAVVATALVAAVILGAEFAAVVWWLGDRFERFDLTQEMPR